ncbi:glycoside hydrolase family 32 protein [Nesterenkonia suensis]
MSVTPQNPARQSTHGDRAPHPDPAFPVAHPRPAAGWLNDPNGLCRVDGVWHVFFQFNPYSAQHDRIHWGHLSSPNLVDWTEEPVALTPTVDGPDRAGCWSGVMGFEDDGTPVAVYSGVQGIENASEVTLARGSADLSEWSQERHVAAGLPEDERVIGVRDPFLVTIGGRRWALQGAGLADGQAAILLYDATDLDQWTYHGVWLSSGQAPDAVDADIWECPQLVRLADPGLWVLIVSRWHRTDDGGHELGDTQALLLEIEDADPADPDPADPGSDGASAALPTLRIVGTSAVDEGPSFYAPQILAEPDRAVMIGWARDLRPQEVSDAAGWRGLLTWPRELTLRDGALVSHPAAECAGWRQGPAHRSDDGDVVLPDACDVVIEPPGSAAAPTSVTLRMLTNTPAGQERAETVFSGPASRIVIDRSIIEVCREDGPACTLRVEPAADQQWELSSDGAAVTWWALRPWSPA